MSNILEVKGLSAYYGPIRALFDIDFTIATGGVTALLGANGAGKTTTLRALCNMIRRTGSSVMAGEDISRKPTEDIVRMGVAHVPEGRGTFAGLTVEENLRLAFHTRRDHAAARRDLEMVFDYFPRLKERIKQQAGTLSGGEQQMLAISRALMLAPRLMLLDEPSFGLAPLVVQEIFRTLVEINRDGLTVLLVEQNVRQALKISTQGYVLETGLVVLADTGASLLANPKIVEHYLGG